MLGTTNARRGSAHRCRAANTETDLGDSPAQAPLHPRCRLRDPRLRYAHDLALHSALLLSNGCRRGRQVR